MAKKKSLLNADEFDINTEAQTRESIGAVDIVGKSEANTKNNTEKEIATKRKVGRPKVKTEDTKNVNVAIPVSTLEKMEIAKECYSKNLTLYINTLIEKDLQENFDKYKGICEQLKQLNIV